jgi:hypothetical protein
MPVPSQNPMGQPLRAHNVQCLILFQDESSKKSCYIFSFIDSGIHLDSRLLTNLFVCSAKLNVRICTSWLVRSPNFGYGFETYCVGQDSSKMGEVALVDSQDTFGRDSLVQAVEYTLVQIARLIVHSRHDRI